MQLLGQPVRHNAFGTGVITGLSGNIITIDSFHRNNMSNKSRNIIGLRQDKDYVKV